VRYIRPVFAIRQSSHHSFPTSSKTCDQLQPSCAATTHEVLDPKKEDTSVQLTDAGCLAISGFCRHPALGDRTEIPTTDGTVTPLIPNNPMTLVVLPVNSDDGDKAEPSSLQDGISQKLEPTSFPVHAPAAPNFTTAAAAGSSSTSTLSSNHYLEATASEGEPSLHQPISVTLLISDALYQATTTRMMDAPPLWRVKARKVLEYLIAKHPKVVSTLSAVLIAVGNIASHPGVSACVGGPILAAVQSAGVLAVTVGEWLRNALDSAAAAPEQAQLSGRRAIEDEVGLEEHHII